MIHRAKRRDLCERDIIKALKAAGASVTQLDGKGLPDLLVGYAQRTFLIECKDPELGARNSRTKGKRLANALGLRDSQVEWWADWQGIRPTIVTTPNDALCAIGHHAFLPYDAMCSVCGVHHGNVT